MKKYDFARDISKIFNVILVIFSILFIFAAFSMLMIFPLYYLSKYFQNIYNLIILAVLGAIFSVLLIFKLVKVWKRYKNPGLFFIHILFYFFIPVAITAAVIIIETLMLRMYFQIFSFIISLTLFIFCNLILITGLILLRRAYYYIKKYLESHQSQY
jgi:hypothetical protein